jgi:hypothetical protein
MCAVVDGQWLASDALGLFYKDSNGVTSWWNGFKND